MASLVLSVLLFVLYIAAVQSEVVVLTDATYADKVKEQDTVWFIKFYAPWCGHCKRLAPAWEELGKSAESEDGVEIAKVDCTTSKSTCEKAGVSAYPTLKIFYNGEEYKKYSGPRDVQSLKTFAVEAATELASSSKHESQAL